MARGVSYLSTWAGEHMQLHALYHVVVHQLESHMVCQLFLPYPE